MKRGFILAILSLFIVITFGGFGMPEKGHAFTTYANCVTVERKSPEVCGIELAAFNASNSTTTNVQQTNTTGFYSNCLATRGDTPENRTACASELTTLTSQNNSSNAPSSQTITTAQQLSQQEALAKTNYQNCLNTHRNDEGGAEAKCISEHSIYNDAMLAVDNFTKQSGYGLTNASPYYVSRTLIDIPPNSDCGITSGKGILACVDEAFGWFIRVTLLNIGGWFLTMGGFLLDWSITSGIRDFNQWVPNGITGLWKLVRDVLYLCIVFIGFYLAFMYIIGRDEKFKKFVPWLIIFALFVNFSLPITKAMIDMTNIVALNIYNSAVPASATGQSAGTAIMEKLDLSKLLSATASQNPSIAVSLLSVIFVFFAAWVFFQIAILMMVRTVTLTLCLIASPFLLIDAMVTVPAFGEHVKKIRSIFFNQLFMADVFMIIFFITLQVMNVLKPKEAITNAALAGTGVGNVGLIFGIFMMMILLHFMMKITKSMSGEVGGLATGVVNSGVGMFAGGAMGLSAMGSRATIGRLAAKARDSSWVKNNQDSFLGRKAYDFSHSVANSSMDARNSAVAQKFSSKTGMGLGKGGNIGYQQNLDNTIKDRADRYQRMGVHQKNVFNDDGTLKYKKGDADNRVETIAAKEEYYNKAGGVIGKTKEEKEEIKQALERNRKTEAEKSLSEYTKLEGQEKQAHFDKQDTKTKELLLKSDISEGRKDAERKDQKEFNKSSVTAQQDLAKAMKDFVKQKETAQTQPSNSSTSNNFATDIKNTNKNEDITIGRGGKTDEKATASGIILPS